MKHLLLTLFALLSLTIATAEEKKVDILPERPPRSIVQLPEVWIEKSACALSASFNQLTTSYTLVITDENDVVIHQEALITDGAKHRYSLPLLDQGVYTIKIQSGQDSYTGTFEI